MAPPPPGEKIENNVLFFEKSVWGNYELYTEKRQTKKK